MSTTDSPAVARRRVRLALRRAREAKHLTQGQIAEAMEWSLSKVMRIEKGDVSISASDLRVLLEYLDVTDPAEVKQLITDARTSRAERWSADPGIREHLTTATQQLIQFEAEATAIRYYGNVWIPGLLQTREYAAAIFAGSGDYADPDDVVVNARIESRLKRRDNTIFRADPPEYLAVLDESVLLRPIGGPVVMGEQLRELLHFMEEYPRVLIRVIPFAAGAGISLLGPFMLLDLGAEQNAVLYREGYRTEEILQSGRETRRHREAFEQMWPLALDEAASVRLIRQHADQMTAAGRGD